MNHKLFILAPFALFFLTSCGSKPTVQLPHVKTVVVSTGALLESDRIIGAVEGKNSADLSFKASGRIASILVSPGDTVKKGQILATLGNEEGQITRDGLSDILADLARMRIDVANMSNNTSRIRSSVADLYRTRAESADYDVQKASLSVSLAEKDLSLAETNLSGSLRIFSGSLRSAFERVSEAEKQLQSAKNTLENSRSSFASRDVVLQKNALSAMAGAFIIARNARDFSDELLGVTDANRTKNDSYESYLSVKNTSVKTDAEQSFIRFNARYDSMYAWYYGNIVGKTPSAETLDLALSGSLSVLSDLRELLHANASVLENSVTSTAFPDSTLTTLKNKNTELLSSLESSILTAEWGGVKGMMNALDTLRTTRSLEIGRLEDAVRIAEEWVSLARTGQDTSGSDVQKNIENLRLAVRMKEDGLGMARASEEQARKVRSMLDSERDAKLAELSAKLAEIASKGTEVSSKWSETRMNRDLAENTIESGIIRAPYDGIILSKLAEQGGVISAGMSIFRFSSTDGKYLKLRYDPASTPLALGESISVRPLGSDATCTGSVTLVSPHPDAMHNKWYFEAELRGCDAIVGVRMEAMIRHTNVASTSGVVIPLSAISSKYSEPGVYVIENNIVHLRLIRVIRSDATSALVEWLQVGERIVIEGKENLTDGEGVE